MHVGIRAPCLLTGKQKHCLISWICTLIIESTPHSALSTLLRPSSIFASHSITRLLQQKYHDTQLMLLKRLVPIPKAPMEPKPATASIPRHRSLPLRPPPLEPSPLEQPSRRKARSEFADRAAPCDSCSMRSARRRKRKRSTSIGLPKKKSMKWRYRTHPKFMTARLSESESESVPANPCAIGSESESESVIGNAIENGNGNEKEIETGIPEECVDARLLCL